MKPRRLALITRRFWPLVGGAERAMAGLAHEFQAMGQSVRVLTGKWESQWPTEIVHREVPVTRLPCPKTRGWGTFRYMSGLKRWLWQHQDNFDAVLVSMLKHDAHVAVKALSRLAKPVIIRAEGSGATGDCAFHETARFGGIMKKTCMKADAIIAPSEKVNTELLASGFDQDRLHFIPNGVEVTDRNRINKEEARRSLAAAHPILNLDPGEPLVVYTGRLDVAKGLLDLIDAWSIVKQTFPRGRLWLVGEGNDSRRIWEKIRDTNLAYEIVMPGIFDDVTDLLIAADAFVLPSYQEGMSLSLLEAMATAVPVIASDIPGNRGLVGDNRGFKFPPRDSVKLAESLLTAIQKQEIADEFAANAKRFVEAQYSLNKMAETHLQVIDTAINHLGRH